MIDKYCYLYKIVRSKNMRYISMKKLLLLTLGSALLLTQQAYADQCPTVADIAAAQQNNQSTVDGFTVGGIWPNQTIQAFNEAMIDSSTSQQMVDCAYSYAGDLVIDVYKRGSFSAINPSTIAPSNGKYLGKSLWDIDWSPSSLATCGPGGFSYATSVDQCRWIAN
jgi:hypothetical protein